jgi:hypothetical protein
VADRTGLIGQLPGLADFHGIDMEDHLQKEMHRLNDSMLKDFRVLCDDSDDLVPILIIHPRISSTIQVRNGR